MKSGKAWRMAAVFTTALMITGAAYASDLKVAVIDVNKILNESAAGKVAKKKIEDRYEVLERKIE